MSSQALTLAGNEYSNKVISRLWAHMGMIYGHKWISQYGKTPAAIWIAGLSDLSADEIKAGVNECATKADGWPPNLPEFRALCRVTVAPTPQAHRRYKALPQPKADPAIAKRHTGALLDMLRGTRTATHTPAADLDAEWLEARRRQDAAHARLAATEAEG